MTRLADRRGLDIGTLGTADALREPAVLQRLADVLGLADFSVLLDVPAGDLVAVTGVPMGDATMPREAEIAELLWDVRRLTAEQVQHVTDIASR